MNAIDTKNLTNGKTLVIATFSASNQGFGKWARVQHIVLAEVDEGVEFRQSRQIGVKVLFSEYADSRNQGPRSRFFDRMETARERFSQIS
jgi:hypothetical protein